MNQYNTISALKCETISFKSLFLSIYKSIGFTPEPKKNHHSAIMLLRLLSVYHYWNGFLCNKVYQLYPQPQNF